EFSEEVLRESGLFSWKQEEGRQAVSAGRQAEAGLRTSDPGSGPTTGSLDSGGALERQTLTSAGNDNSQEAPTDGAAPGAGSRKPEAELAEGRRLTPDARSAMYSKFRNRVMFPIASEAGKVIAFTGRALSTDEKAGPKYLNSPETPIY